MSWIHTIPYEKATGRLKKLYDQVKGPENRVDNVLSIHSLRPHSLVGHMSLYKNVLHHSHNELPKWYLEAIGVYVSYLNDCDYCVAHHLAGLKRLWNDSERGEAYMVAIRQDAARFFDQKLNAGLAYAYLLTKALNNISEATIQQLKKEGFDDGQILEINQVACYFNYVNRMVVGLGVTTDGDVLGLSPNDSDDPNNWNHS
ncbi:MAG: peroxidase-related enzyme [Gilvibacter sp.]